MRTSLVILCVSAFIYFYASYFTRQSLWKLACIFVFLYLATIERNNLAILLPISVIFFAFVYPDEFKIKKAFKIFIFITAILLLALVLTYSQQDQDGRKFLSPMGLNFYMGNNPNSTGAHTESVKEQGLRHDAVGHITQSHAIAEKAVGQSLSETEAGWYWIRKSLNFMYTEPQSYIQLKLKQVGLFFGYAASGLPEDYRVRSQQR